MYIKLTKEEKQQRKEQRKQAREQAKKQAKIKAEKEQKKVKELTISIEWKKSRTWGNNPHASAGVSYQDGTYQNLNGFTCSGCGYCKESTVIAQIFNATLLYKLHEIAGNNEAVKNHPYGIYLREDWKHYNGGVGTDCYYRIAEFIGGKFEKIASGKTFDVFKYTDGK